jgi:hypothetical protein
MSKPPKIKYGIGQHNDIVRTQLSLKLEELLEFVPMREDKIPLFIFKMEREKPHVPIYRWHYGRGKWLGL